MSAAGLPIVITLRFTRGSGRLTKSPEVVAQHEEPQ